MFYETATNDHGLPHDPFKALVAPRPIGWISTRAANGDVNLAPYSFFNGIASNPPIVMFSSTGFKDAASFAIESGAFVCNLATADLAEAMVRTSAPAERGVSEFGFAGLTPADCRLVAAPRVAESPAAMECRVTEWFQPKDIAGATVGDVVVLGQVIGVHIDESILVDGQVDMGRARPLSRLGYLDYAIVDEVFAMRRPKEPDASDI